MPYIHISSFSYAGDNLVTYLAWDSKPYPWNFLVPCFFSGSASHLPLLSHLSKTPLSLFKTWEDKFSLAIKWALKSKPSYSRLSLWQFKSVHLMLSYLCQHFPFPSSTFKDHFKGFLVIKLHSLRHQCTSLKKPTIHIRKMQSTHHDSFLLSLYSLKAVLYLWTAWYHWTVPECLLWVTKLATANLLDFIQSRAGYMQFISLGPPSISPPPSASRQWAPSWVLLPTSLGPLSHSHWLNTVSQTCSPFSDAKGKELDPICSELLCCSHAGETNTSLPPSLL